ncbi:tRNA (N6-isopentenyl adenosine(37)-C2)-methylthiotransferase MiaB [uncultured Enorma sp.]|uniref:tRNA (N6-isopentenyl adenosine(37)-C2)-methylthiotransferase MiaB n=1 Tax=uncultured Enorma sp. TaxID=1714346 RepID=UPI0025E9918D|nr:tRNA (N6-isopentenyl adenosine(37)-C2)-methylthiotransferase MiaB [uncultured Enorma sp.]
MSHQDTQSILAGKTYFIRTFGCQMNLHDSERVSGLLDSLGCFLAADPADADIVIFMTCCVREAADQRLYGQCSSCKSLPVPPSGKRVIAVGGCIAQRDGERLLSHIDNVDVIFGTQAIAHVDELLAQAFEDDERHIDTAEGDLPAATTLPWHREQPFHAWVPIMTGCNNFCTYCIVPYVRGREKSRPFDAIVDEVAGLVRCGVREVTLLGQNVNSYGRDVHGEPRFAELLRAVGETGIERIRFTSSHPKDLSLQTIETMAEVPAVMPHLQLAVQSGSSRILKLMNRRYSREDYLRLVDAVRERIPGIALTTDIIVGFPGETEEDFEQTLSLAEEVGYAQAFTFIYSRREGTPAAKIEDSTPREVIQERFDRLVKAIEGTAYAFNQHELGQRVPVLVEGASKKDARILQGKSPKNQTVHAPIPEGASLDMYVGHIVDVDVDVARTWYLSGTVAGDPR